MKKHLLATTAAITMVGGAASAQEWNLDWGGFYNSHVIFNDVGGNAVPAGRDNDGTVLYTSGEIVFTPSITLDNGLTFGARVDIEAASNGRATDENFATMSSDTMGRVEFGATNSAGFKMMVGAPGVGLGINSPSNSAFLPITGTVLAGLPLGANAFGSSFTEVAGANDVPRISYYTPSFNGLTLGVSYASNNANTDSRDRIIDRGVNTGRVNDIFDIAASYSQSFGNVDMTLSARWGTGEAATIATVTPIAGATSASQAIVVPAAVQLSDPETWGIGAQFSVGAFTFGGSYAENKAATAAGPLTSGVGDTEGWSLGATYELAGGWTVGFDTYQGEQDLGPIGVGLTRGKAEYEAYKLGAQRSLGTGVTWQVYAIQAEASASVPGAVKQKVDTTSIGTGINLTF